MARRWIPLLLIVLCLALLPVLPGCSASTDDTAQDQRPITPQEKEARIRQANEKLKNANADVGKYEGEFEAANTEIGSLRDKADKLQKQAEDLVAQSRRSGKNVNFDDPKEAPTTAPVRKKFHDADAAVKAAEAKAQGANNKVQDARARVTQATKELEAAQKAAVIASGTADDHSPGILTTLWSLFPTIMLALAGLIFFGVLFWFTWRKISDGHARTDVLIRGLSQRQDDRLHEVNATLSGFKDLNMRLAIVQEEVTLLTQIVQTERRARLADGREDPYAPPFTPTLHSQPVVEEEIAQFPTSASAFLARLSGQEPSIKFDPLKNLLVKDIDGRGQLVLLENLRVPGGLTYIVPSVARFQTKEDFYNHYEKFYECNRPAAGEVWLQEPAVVDKVEGGWRLRDKGQLEIK